MPSTPGQSAHNAAQQHQQSASSTASASAHHQPMGRSQSAFNFLLSKAKAPFASSTGSTSINTSTSLSSLSAGSDPLPDEVDHHLQYHRQLHNDHAVPHAPPQMAARQANGVSDRANRDSATEAQSASRPSMPFSKTSYTDETSASPSKKGFFAGMSRDKKLSSSSKLPAPAAKAAINQSPLTKSFRHQDSAASGYSQFSKSQSDLHSRSNLSSPSSHFVDLPRIPGPYQQQSASAERTQFLRSPSPAMNFSRSVDDLSSSVTASSSPVGSSLGQDESNSTALSSTSALLGEQAAAGHTSQLPHRAKAVNGKLDSASPNTAPTEHTQPSTHQLNVNRPDAKHARKLSKLTGKDMTGRGVVASSLAATLGFSHAPMMQTSFSQSSAIPASLPHGASFQGFLSRNASISLSVAQLNEQDSKGRIREKDVSKGWKPYRVILQDGKLLFYKPSSNYTDEIRAHFPSYIVHNSPQGALLQDPLSILTPEALVKGGLSKSELLAATSGTADAPASHRSPNARARPSLAASPSSNTIGLSGSPTASGAVSPHAWVATGRHSDLVLVEHIAPPKHWTERIHKGSIAALADEYVRGTQIPNQTPLLSPSEHQTDAELFVLTVICCSTFSGEVAGRDQLGDFLTLVHKHAQIVLETQDLPLRSAVRQRLAILCETALQAGLALPYISLLQMLAQLAENSPDVSVKLTEAAEVQHAPLAQPQASTDWSAVLASRSEPEREELQELRKAIHVSADLLLRLEPLEFAQQIQAYHAQHLPILCQSHLTILETIQNAARSKCINAFSFDPSTPHPITSLALSHILDTSRDEAATATSQVGARHRASVLRHWIAIASYLLSLGDVAGWLAVTAALCSRAVVRLEQTWRYLAEGDRLLVAREWSPILSSLSWVEGPPTAIKSRFCPNGQYAFIEAEDGRILACVPYLGNALTRILPQRGGDTFNIAANVQYAASLAQTISRWQATRLANLVPIAGHAKPQPEFQAMLQRIYSETAMTKCADAANMRKSLKLEPKTLGASEAFSRETLPVGTNHALPLVPLLFPQPLPVLSLLDAPAICKQALYGEDRPSAPVEDAATANSRNIARAFRGSPLLRSAMFSPPLSSRHYRQSAFSGVLEWSPNTDDQSNILRIGNELVLRIVQEPNVSLPNSPMLAKRLSQDFQRSPRPLSQVSKRSSLPASNRNSMFEVTVPVEVTVKSATLNRMIDVLVMGVSHILITGPQSGGEDVDPMRKSKLSLDMDAYRTTFLATFRSLCSPTALFEQLCKRFGAAVHASKELITAETYQTSSQFPSWLSITPIGSHTEPADWAMVSTIRMGVAKTLRMWIERFPQDFADDDNLYLKTLAFLRKSGVEQSSDDGDQYKVLHALTQLQGAFVACITGANAHQEERSYICPHPVQVTAAGSHSEFDFDEASPASLVEYLESIATVFFDKINDRDLLVASEVFERQSCSLTAWFAGKHNESKAKEDERPINSMYTLLDTLKCTTTSDATLQQMLPAAVRDALAAQSLFRGWIAIHIIESGIGIERRQERLLKLIDALWICRSRMARLRGDGAGSGSDTSLAFCEPTIGSFVESAIVSTLGSSESRIFLRAWQGVAVTRGGKGDVLADLFPREIDNTMQETTQLSSTPDIGWILTCLAEATTRTQAKDHTDPLLIDFDKRRTIWALVDGAMRVRPACNSSELIDLAGTRLKVMQSALTRVSWDRRAFKEDAASELRNAPPLPKPSSLRSSSSSKALSGISKQQQEKLRRDRVALEALESAVSGPSISSRMSSMPSSGSRSSVMTSQPLNNGIHFADTSTASALAANPDKTSVRSKRMTALFKGAVRPLMASDKHDVPARSVADLMRLTLLQKPSIVAGLGGAQVVQWNNSQRSFVFHLTSEEGAKFLLQAPSGPDLNEWITHIGKVAADLAPRKRDTHAIRPGASVRSKIAGAPVFGRPLAELVEREGLSVPSAMERMFAEVEARGLREVGIYRISGSKNTVDGLRRAWDQQPPETINLAQGEFSDVHTITGAVKAWLRELPDPVITHDSYDAIIATSDMENDDRLYAIRDIIWRLPKCHFDMLRRTAEHLARVVEEGEHNKMMSHNIGLIFGTSLLNPPPGPSSVAIGFGNIGKAANVVKTIVTMYEWLFEPEPEPEPQAVQPKTELCADDDGQAAAASLPPPEADSLSTPDTEVAAATEVEVAMAEVEVATDEEEGDLPELVEQPRRSGRRRPLTMVGLESLGSEEQAMLRSYSEDNSEAATNLRQADGEPTLFDNVTPEVDMPTIVLSQEGGGEQDDFASSASSMHSTGAVEEAMDKLTASASLDDNTDREDDDPSRFARPAKERPPNSLTPGGGYRDSIYSSYSLYADTLDNVNFESQTSASSMVAKRRSAMLAPSADTPLRTSDTAELTKTSAPIP